jgi:hypothetical protein
MSSPWQSFPLSPSSLSPGEVVSLRRQLLSVLGNEEEELVDLIMTEMGSANTLGELSVELETILGQEEADNLCEQLMEMITTVRTGGTTNSNSKRLKQESTSTSITEQQQQQQSTRPAIYDIMEKKNARYSNPVVATTNAAEEAKKVRNLTYHRAFDAPVEQRLDMGLPSSRGEIPPPPTTTTTRGRGRGGRGNSTFSSRGGNFHPRGGPPPPFRGGSGTYRGAYHHHNNTNPNPPPITRNQTWVRSTATTTSSNDTKQPSTESLNNSLPATP